LLTIVRVYKLYLLSYLLTLGCAGKGELVFVVDTADHNDQHTFTAGLALIKDVIQLIADCILPESLRLGFVYDTQNDRQQFGLIAFQNADNAIAAIGNDADGFYSASR